ncbi:MAG TPA: site-specific integrase [Tenuifilaceae bacterium]|nr:site-specific integrase [Tenuifilaceae bacterium]
MKRTTFTVLFYLKRAKLLRTGETPIYCRVTVNGSRFEFSIKRSVNPDNWNSAKACATGGAKYREINNRLDQIKYKLYESQKLLEDRGRSVTAENLQKAYNGKFEEEKNLIELYQDHNDSMQKLIGNSVAEDTHARHETSKNHLKSFLISKYGRKDIPVCEINQKFIKDYEVYLRSDRGCNNNTTVKYIKNFKKIVKIAFANGWIKSDPFIGIKYRLEETDMVFLTQMELEMIEKKEIDIDRIGQVRDVFLFCCYTGLAFVDVKNLKPEDISVGVDGKKWIVKRRQKSQQKFSIPLIEKALHIIIRYKNNPYCNKKGVLLPVLSNQKMNAYLKEVADICKVKKNLTTHAARHTFATTVTLANGISMEVVSKMLGHSSIEMTKHYARITEQLISNEMAKLG